MRYFCFGLMLCVALPGSTAVADELEAIDTGKAEEFAKVLSELAVDIGQQQVKIQPDPSKAQGVHRPQEAGLLLVPDKRLQAGASEVSDNVNRPTGASLAYLFAYHLAPVIDGKAAPAKDLHSVVYQSDEGDEARVNCLLLAVRKLSEDDWRLYVYGADEKPLLDVRFDEGSGPGATPLAIECKNVQGYEGDVVITVFDKYQASFKVRYVFD